MVHEIKYTTEQLSTLNQYIESQNSKIDKNKDCFVFYYVGNSLINDFPDQLTCHQFIKELESRFNININWFDLSWIFDRLCKQYTGKFKLNENQLLLLLNQLKTTYHISLSDYCNKLF